MLFYYINCLFQIEHMIAFIDQEANEKVDEINAKVGVIPCCKLHFVCLN